MTFRGEVPVPARQSDRHGIYTASSHLHHGFVIKKAPVVPLHEGAFVAKSTTAWPIHCCLIAAACLVERD